MHMFHCLVFGININGSIAHERKRGYAIPVALPPPSQCPWTLQGHNCDLVAMLAYNLAIIEERCVDYPRVGY